MKPAPPHGSGLFVVVPYFNEERWLNGALEALAAQTDREFCLVMVDNSSTDGSLAVLDAFRHGQPGLCVHAIGEAQKGTGAAADTGFRYAISQGARFVARTDADCLPDSNWVFELRKALEHDALEFVAGAIRPRTDEPGSVWTDRAALPAMIWLAETYVRVTRSGPPYRSPAFLVSGNNLAIASDLYVRSGGFPRTRIEEAHEDRVLSDRVRILTDRAARRPSAIVYNSARRVRAYGYLNTLRWYRNHGHRHPEVDVR